MESRFNRTPSPFEELPPLRGWHRTFAALRNVNYRWFYGGQTLSLIGTWARSAAWGWMAFQLTHSEFWTGFVFMLNSLPILLFSVYAGSLADRVSKLRIFKITSGLALTASLSLSILLFNGPVHIGLLMVFVALWGLTTAFEMPARQSLLVELVGRKDLVNAIALNSAMVNATRVIGPAVGGVLLSIGGNQSAYSGAAWCFLLDAVSFIAVLFSLYHIKTGKAAHVRSGNLTLKYYLEGFKYLRQHPLLAETIFLLFVMSLGGWAYLSQLPAFVQNQLHLGAAGYGWLLSMTGLGACVAALMIATLGDRLVRKSVLYTGIGLYSLAVLLLGFQRNPIAAAFFLLLSGFGIILFFSAGNSLIQTHSPDRLRGRIMGIWSLVFGGGMPFGSLWMGTIASHTGSGAALQAGGLFCVLGALFVFMIFKKRAKNGG